MLDTLEQELPAGAQLPPQIIWFNCFPGAVSRCMVMLATTEFRPSGASFAD